MIKCGRHAYYIFWVEMGSRTLGACLQRCRESVGEVNERSFKQLMQSMVESVWGRDLGLSSKVRWVEPTTTKGPENLLWRRCTPPKGIPDDGG